MNARAPDGLKGGGRMKRDIGRRREIRVSMRVWDAPTRLFHWAVVLCLIVSYVSIETDHATIHFYSGFTLLTLLLFRLAWGVVGSETSRFTRFLRSPAEAFRHLAHFRQREPDNQIGHNAAGGWMVLVMLALIAVQVGTGLFSGDPESFLFAPLAPHLSNRTINLVTTIHGWDFYVLLAAIVLHVLAVTAYAVFKKQNLLRPMVTGRKRLPATMHQPRMASPALALLLLILAAVLVWALVTWG